MINIIKMELYNLKHLTIYKGLLLIEFVVAVLVSLTGADGLDSGFAYFQEAYNNPFTLTIFASLLAGFFIGTDFESKTIQRHIASGHSRMRILLAKAFAYYLAIIPFFLIYPAVGAIIGTMSFGWGDMASMLYVLRVIFLELLMGFAIGSIPMFLNFLFENRTIAIGCPVVGSILVSVIHNLVKQNTSVIQGLNSFAKLTPLYFMKVITRIETSTGELTGAVLSAVITIAIMILASYLVYYKRELK